MTIDELKRQRRWVVWKLEAKPGQAKPGQAKPGQAKPGQAKPSKVPYQPNGKKARNNDPSTFSTFAECEAVVSGFSGIGMELGLVDGVYITGMDLDDCCDAFTGRFTPESREYVIGLDSYAEYSPSGTGSHTWVMGTLTEDKPIVKKVPGCKQIEIKGTGFYHTYTGRHISKTPAEVMDRQEQLDALCKRIPALAQSGVRVTVPQDDEERFRKLMAGDFSDYNDDLSRADLGLLNILARRLHNDIYKITDAWVSSPLYREKLERTDYRSATILKAIKGEPVFTDDDDETMTDDGIDEWVVEVLEARRGDGWFPCGDVSLIGGGSGTGKTYFIMDLLERARLGKEVWGHKTIAKDYRVLLHDRGAASMRRTVAALGLSAEARQRVIRLTSHQQAKKPGEVLEAACERNPSARVWFIEGLDMWSSDANRMEKIAPMIDGLQRVATRRKIAVIASVGAGKMKTSEGHDPERYRGRDALYGSGAMARKAETVILMSEHDKESPDYNPRLVCVYPRIGRMELFWIDKDEAGKLHVVDPPQPKEREYKGPPSKAGLVKKNVFAMFKPGDRLLFTPELGVCKSTFEDWRKAAVAEGIIEHREGYRGGYFIPAKPD